MGLDTSHNCWHGPYTAFTRWRNAVAEAAGYEVKPVKDDSGMVFQTAQIDWEAIERENMGCYQGEWRTEQPDPVVYLIAHSDCDGALHPAQSGPLADRLEELLPSVKDSHPFDNHREKTQRFIDGLRTAVAAGEDVDFH